MSHADHLISHQVIADKEVGDKLISLAHCQCPLSMYHTNAFYRVLRGTCCSSQSDYGASTRAVSLKAVKTQSQAGGAMTASSECPTTARGTVKFPRGSSKV